MEEQKCKKQVMLVTEKSALFSPDSEEGSRRAHPETELAQPGTCRAGTVVQQASRVPVHCPTVR